MSWLTGPSKPNPIVTGYRYYLGMHMIAGHGNMDAVEKIKVGEKVVWTESNIIRDSNISITSSDIVTPTGWRAQTFIASSNYTLSSVTLMMWKFTYYHPGIITVSIRATDIDGHPTGEDLCVGTTDGETLPNVFALADAEWREIEFTAPIILTSGIKYAIVVRTTESEVYDGVFWNIDINVYANGRNENSSNCGKTWIAPVLSFDYCFKCNQKNGTAPNCTITINNSEIFGGNKSEGGIYGNVDLMFGDITQTQNSYLVNNLDSDIPAFRGLMSFILNRVYIGTGTYLKPWSFFCKRVCKQISGDDQWYREKAVIRPATDDGDDLNPAHIIRECLIDSEWGLGFSTDDIDDATFKEAANILYDESFGLSILWDQIQPIDEFIDTVLRYIAGFLYQDLTTGKWILTLTRNLNYDNPYDYYNTGDIGQGSRSNTTTPGKYQFAQTFTTLRNYNCNKIKIKIYKDSIGLNTFNVKVELQGTDADGYPDGNILAHGTIPNSELSTSAEWIECIFTTDINLVVNTKYALVVYPVGTGTFYWRVNTFSSFEGGHYESSTDYGATWTIVYTNDFMFEIYAGGNLETFNEDDIINIEDYARPSYGEIVNQVVINWWDKIAHKSRPATAIDEALIEKEGGNLIELVQNFYGICNATLANQVAERELKLASSMLAVMRIKATRKMSHLKPNDIFRLSWSDLDITQMIVRVLEVDYGNLENNEIHLNCIEDSFSTAETIFGDPVVTLWTNPISDPINVIDRKLIEIPYWDLCNNLETQSIVDAYTNSDIGFIGIAAVKPVLDAFDFKYYIKYKTGYDFIFEGWGTWCPSATINSLPMNAENIIVNLENEISLDFVVEGSYAIIDDEIVKILAVDITNNQIEIARGILDTVPTSHIAESRIYFVGSNYVPVQKEYTNGDQPKVKLLTRTANGILPEADATEITADLFNSRMIRPYPPGNLKFNAESYPFTINSTVHGNKIAITWNHRDRTNANQLQSLIEHTNSINYGPEAGTTYTIKIYNANNVLKRTVTGLTGTSYDYTEAFEIADCGSIQNKLRFVIYAVKGSYNSWKYSYDITLYRVRGTSSALSNVTGSLGVIRELESSIIGASNVSGSFNLSKILEGNSTAISFLLAVLRGAHLKLQSNSAGVSNVSGSLDSQPGCVGFTAGVSNVIGLFLVRLIGNSVGTSGVSGSLNSQPKCVGSSAGVSGASGSLDSQPGCEGLFAGISNIIGILTVPGTLKDYYTSGIDAQNPVYWYGTTYAWLAQTFTPSENYYITDVKLLLYRSAGLPGNVTLSIRATDGTGKPTEADLCSATINGDDITTDSAGLEYTFSFSSSVSLISGIKYAIVLKHPEIEVTYVRWKLDIAGANYAGGSYYRSLNAGTTWESDADVDFYFETYGN